PPSITSFQTQTLLQSIHLQDGRGILPRGAGRVAQSGKHDQKHHHLLLPLRPAVNLGSKETGRALRRVSREGHVLSAADRKRGRELAETVPDPQQTKNRAERLGRNFGQRLALQGFAARGTGASIQRRGESGKREIRTMTYKRRVVVICISGIICCCEPLVPAPS
ncbi:unnamed protein product, partial [Amoebophrya sp. A120]